MKLSSITQFYFTNVTKPQQQQQQQQQLKKRGSAFNDITTQHQQIISHCHHNQYIHNNTQSPL